MKGHELKRGEGVSWEVIDSGEPLLLGIAPHPLNDRVKHFPYPVGYTPPKKKKWRRHKATSTADDEVDAGESVISSSSTVATITSSTVLSSMESDVDDKI